MDLLELPLRTLKRAWPQGLVARKCSASDAEELWALFSQRDVRRFAMMDTEPFETPSTIENWLRDTRAGAFQAVGLIDGTIAGFAGLYPLPGRQNHVGSIMLSVHEGFRGKGVGSSLLLLLLATADHLAGLSRVQLHVLADNLAAISLYRSFGFRIEGRHNASIQGDDGYLDAYSMARTLAA